MSKKIEFGTVRRLRPDEIEAAGGGLPLVDFFELGLAEMAEGDYRQFEMTPENAKRMTNDGNAFIKAKGPMKFNYGHDRGGPKSGEIHAFENSTFGVRVRVKWTPRAAAAIKCDPSEYDGLSPEFLAEWPVDDKGNSVLVDGRILIRPYEALGGALTNNPAMPGLALAAETEEGDGMPKFSIETLKKLNLAEGATQAEFDAAVLAVIEKAEADAKAAKDAEEAASKKASDDAAAAVTKSSVSGISKELLEEAGKVAMATVRSEFAAVEKERTISREVASAIGLGKLPGVARTDAEASARANPEAFAALMKHIKPGASAPVTSAYQASASEALTGRVDAEGLESEAFREQAASEARELMSKDSKLEFAEALQKVLAKRAA
ncbi:MAG: phage protease [Thermoanaerobaculia bacterium]